MSLIREVVLCPQCGGVSNPCCPIIKINNNIYIIEDDFGNSITIDSKDINSLINDVNKIVSVHRDSLDN